MKKLTEYFANVVFCKICSFEGKSLSAHLKMHGLTSEEYKLKYPGAKIISNGCSKKLIEGQKKGCLEKYGVESNFQIPAVVKTIRNKMIKRCGPKGQIGLKETQDKCKKTRLKRYGAEYMFQLKEIQESGLKAIEDKYGVRSVWMLPEIQKKSQINAQRSLSKGPTSIERKVMKMVPKNVEYVGNKGFFITCKTSFGKIIHRCPDFIIHPIKDRKVIEVFGDYWHRNDKEKDIKREYAMYDYKVLIIWEHQLKDDIKNTKKKILEFVNPSETTRSNPCSLGCDIVRSS